MQLRRTLSILLVTIAFVPFTALAANVDDVLRVEDDPAVTRGDFIRAAVQILGMENMQVDQRHDLPYRRVAKGLEPYIRIAHEKNALESFGFDLLLAQGITRGQALRVLVNLTGFDTVTPATYKDTKLGTPDERAVRVAVDRDWMQPLRDNLFGVNRMLTGRDAKLLLRKVNGEGGASGSDYETSVPTIKFNLKTNSRLNNLPKTQLLESIWKVIETEYLRSDDIDLEEAAYSAAEGIVNSLGDKYTTFMRPVESRQFQSRFAEETSGIGAQVEFIDDVLTVVSPIKGSPAEAAGIMPGDQIIQADGVPLAGLSFFESVEKVRGPKGSSVKLTIRRSGIELNIDVVRDVISIPDVVITWHNQNVVVQLTQFGQNADHNLRPQMEEIAKKNPTGIVLDLRSNPGGLLTAANEVVSMFVPKGSKFVEVRKRDVRTPQYTTAEQVIDDSIPVIVLIDEGSASASEIVAGALQDIDRATIIGGKSFGKGTVQSVLGFSDQSSLKITIAEWYTPNGNKIDGEGVHPDIGISEVQDSDAPLKKALEQLKNLARMR